MKTLQPITTTILTLVLLVAGTLGFALQASACPAGQCEYAVYTDERPSGTSWGDGLTHNIWNTRTVNETVIEQGGSVSRSGNEITLQPGTYYINVIAQFFGYGSGSVTHSKLRLRTTDNQTLAYGHSATVGAYYGGGDSQLLTYITVQSTPVTFRIEQHIYNQGSAAVYGGATGLSGEPEVFLTIRIVKITDDKCH